MTLQELEALLDSDWNLRRGGIASLVPALKEIYGRPGPSGLEEIR
jgi:hypothetical protein